MVGGGCVGGGCNNDGVFFLLGDFLVSVFQKMEQSSETLARKIYTPGNHPKESIQNLLLRKRHVVSEV